ncbi:TPA: hypothetical protein ACFP4Q_000842 [Neisseria weaveri]
MFGGFGGGNGGNNAGGTYDDTAIKKQLARLEERVARIETTRKEYQAAYVPRGEFPEIPENSSFMTITFPKPFSKVPFVKATLDVKDSSVRFSYQANATKTGFDIALNYAPSLNGVWYEAHVID